MNVITGTTTDIYQFICQYKAARDGIAPTYSEIMRETGIKSKSTVYHHLDKLESAGMIKRIHNREGGIMVTGGQWSMQQ